MAGGGCVGQRLSATRRRPTRTRRPSPRCPRPPRTAPTQSDAAGPDHARRPAVSAAGHRQGVYDYRRRFQAATIAKVQATADAIEAADGRPGRRLYAGEARRRSRRRPSRTPIRLMDQWGVGRKGFDDGLVILFDLDRSRQHGQVQLYAGPGFRATFLDQRGTPGDLPGRHAAVPSPGRSRRRDPHRDEQGRRGGHAVARPVARVRSPGERA